MLTLGIATGCGLNEGDYVLRLRPSRPSEARAKLIGAGALSASTLDGLRELASLIAADPDYPFDGLVIRTELEPWSDTRLDTASYQPYVDALQDPGFAPLTENLLYLSLPPGGLDWFDDGAFDGYLVNVHTFGHLARDAGMRGIFFDTQPYGVQVFQHTEQPSGASFAETQVKVRARGRALMESLLDAYPDLTIMTTFGYADVFRAVCLQGQALETERYGLLPAFLDGISDAIARAASGSLVDGFLAAYPTTDPRAFPLFRDVIHYDWNAIQASYVPNVLTYRFPLGGVNPWDGGEQRWPEKPVLSCEPAARDQLTRDISASFGLMLDYRSESGEFRTDQAAFSENHRTPSELSTVMEAALRSADRYVWLWSSYVNYFERPEVGLTPLPEAYRRVLREAHADLD